MDWYLDAGAAEGRVELESLVLGHLRRRLPGLDEEVASLVRQALAQGVPAAAGAWVELVCDQASPVLTIRGLRPGTITEVLGPELAPGLWAASRSRPLLSRAAAQEPGLTFLLPGVRPSEADVDLGPARLQTRGDPVEFVPAVATALPAAMDAGLTALEAAAACGVAGADLAEDLFGQEHGGRRPASAAEAAEAFASFATRAGGDFTVVEADGRRAVLVNHRCPFGEGVVGRPITCRVSSAALGSLGARLSGRAQVAIDEALALGDPQCRLVVELDPEKPSPVAHLYNWPPSGSREAGSHPVSRGFRVGLTIQLPRDRLSVPIVRHLVTRTLAEVGALEEDASDVEVALSEACSNVIEHSGPGDAYEVLVTIGPMLAEIRVVDIGRGFDHAALSTKASRASDERGRGIRLMHALVDQVSFQSAPERGTVVHLVKRLHFDESSPVRRLMLSALAGQPN